MDAQYETRDLYAQPRKTSFPHTWLTPSKKMSHKKVRKALNKLPVMGALRGFLTNTPGCVALSGLPPGRVTIRVMYASCDRRILLLWYAQSHLCKLASYE